MEKKLRLFLADFKEKGFLFALTRVFVYLFRPFDFIMNQNRILIEFKYNLWPRLHFWKTQDFLKLPQTDLAKAVKHFWYGNTAGVFKIDNDRVTRKEIFIYGGPDVRFECVLCQKSEWLSRVRQRDLFIPHVCSQSRECQDICKKQGDELWANYHQNFKFSLKCDEDVPAAKMLYLDPNWDDNFLRHHCDVWQLLTQRRLAFSLQVDVAREPRNIDWSKYDCLFLVNNGRNMKFKRPDIPVLLYGHDCWPLNDRGFQWVIDWIQPDVFLSSCLAVWQENYKFPDKTRFAFYPFFDSSFYARPNLNEKKYDLLVIGALAASLYRPRMLLNEKIERFSRTHAKYQIELSKLAGSGNVFRSGGVVKEDVETGRKMRFLNKWSEYLGSSKYVIFGRTEYSFVTGKHYEVLGSGAIPIFPEAADLKYLGVEPFVHYIPLSEVENNDEKLAYYLDNYDKYRFIADNAVKWYKENSDRLIFNDFEDIIREITNHKYPKRLI